MRQQQARGIKIAHLATLFGISLATAYRDLALVHAPKHDWDSMLEAGLAWWIRYGTWPTSEAWHSSHAKDTAIDFARKYSGEAYARWLSGYHPLPEPTRLLPWPASAAVSSVFGGFPEFVEALKFRSAELQRMGTPYEPIPLDPSHVALCEARGALPDTPHTVPAIDENEWMLSVAGVMRLLALCGELEMHDGYGRAAEDPNAQTFRWPPTDVPPATGVAASTTPSRDLGAWGAILAGTLKSVTAE